MMHSGSHIYPLYSYGAIQSVFLVETLGTHDLPYYLQWLRLMSIRSGILLLVNIEYYDDQSVSILNEIAQAGIDVIKVELADKSGRPVVRANADNKGLLPNSFPLPATDLVFRLIDHSDGQCGVLYIGGNARYDYGTLRDHPGFMAALQKIGISQVITSTDGIPLLEGGDCLFVSGHFFIGTRTKAQYGYQADSIIRERYSLSSDLHIHFVGVDHPDPRSGLYHLDLYFTYGGADIHGKHRFFAGYIDDSSIGDAIIPEMKKQLEHFKKCIELTLDLCFPGCYDLIPVPIICCDVYRFSPLNGILGDVKGVPTYYFPWPDFINFMAHPEYNTQTRITISVQRAYDIIAGRMEGVQNVIKLNVPLGYTAGSGQSLHCTMAVIGRDQKGL